jgi:glycosyltransferase involved in cell wall biosynthesis
MSRVPVSVIVPVKNEAANIERCLRSVQWADEIFVVDSNSTDDTLERAARLGAQTPQFTYQSPWPKKKNWALANLPLRHEWVLLLDADETMPPEAEEEIRRIVSQPGDTAGYWINRRFLFMDRWLRHAYYPNWNLRLFKHRLGRFERLTDEETESGDIEIHEHLVVDGKTDRLTSEMAHYAFPTVTTFIEKHNRYASWEAHVLVQPHTSGEKQPVKWHRRITLPCRPLLRFLYVYIWQRGFLDGAEGYYFARLHGVYELLTAAKTHELRRRRRGEGSE